MTRNHYKIILFNIKKQYSAAIYSLNQGLLSSLQLHSQIRRPFYNNNQMVLIEYTNIVVDDFSEAKQRPFSKYIHFLTHMHTDHFNGLNDSWNLGTIYCSQITADLLTHKFPKLHSLVHPLQLYQPYEIPLSPDTTIKVTVTLFDANHCAGAVMILFQGYMGTILHTGDIRFNKEKFKQYSYLYPANKINPQFQACSKHIDVLYLDNTFCDPVFEFPEQEEVLGRMVEAVRGVGKRRVYVGLDNIGKEELLVELARKLETLVVVSNTRYQNIIHMGFDHEIFTTDVNQGWIEVVPKKQLRSMLTHDKSAIGIVPTGWCNKAMYCQASRTYFMPYSLHSNFKQLQAFVRSLYPSSIIPIVRSHSKRELIQSQLSEQKQNWQQIYTMASVRQTGLLLLKQYNSPCSKDHLELKNNVQMQKAINKKLTLLQTSQERGLLQMKNMIVKEKEVRRSRKGAKLNVEVDRREVEKSREMLNDAVIRKMMERPSMVVVGDEDEEEEDNSKGSENIGQENRGQENRGEKANGGKMELELEQIRDIEKPSEVIEISDESEEENQIPMKRKKTDEEIFMIRQVDFKKSKQIPKKQYPEIKVKLLVPTTTQQVLDQFFKPRPKQ